MRTNRTRCGLAVLLFSALTLSSAASEPKLEVRLQNHLTSYASPAGTAFRCVVIRQLETGGRMVIPKGSIVYGKVAKATGVGIGLKHERAALELTFNQLETPDGKRVPLVASLASIDNSREHVTPQGRIKGVLAANNPGSLLNGFWAKPQFGLVFRSLEGLTGVANQIWARYSMGPIGAAALYAARCIIVSFPEPEIHLPPGTDMVLKVQVPEVDSSMVSDGDAPDLATEEIARDLPDWLNGRLDRISRANGQIAPDLFNVALLGTREDLISAFITSGWSVADSHTLINSSRVFRAFSAMRSYTNAPVSRLFYRGTEPDLVFEKSFDTVTQRHHVRFWEAGNFEGKEVWLGAATHDTGVKFKASVMKFTHKIDTNLDNEREKVSTDLDFAGCSGAPVYLNVKRDSSGLSGPITTDARLAVLAVHSCEAPPTTDDGPARPGNKFTRLTRRAILETRNYLERDNAYYWAYRAITSRHTRSSEE
jgi:LssY-like putative type I secretion system component LssY